MLEYARNEGDYEGTKKSAQDHIRARLALCSSDEILRWVVTVFKGAEPSVEIPADATKALNLIDVNKIEMQATTGIYKCSNEIMAFLSFH